MNNEKSFDDYDRSSDRSVYERRSASASARFTTFTMLDISTASP